MTSGKTTRLKKQNNVYEIDIPEEFITNLDWQEGHLLEINTDGKQLVVEKLHGFVGT